MAIKYSELTADEKLLLAEALISFQITNYERSFTWNTESVKRWFGVDIKEEPVKTSRGYVDWIMENAALNEIFRNMYQSMCFYGLRDCFAASMPEQMNIFNEVNNKRIEVRLRYHHIHKDTNREQANRILDNWQAYREQRTDPTVAEQSEEPDVEQNPGNDDIDID